MPYPVAYFAVCETNVDANNPTDLRCSGMFVGTLADSTLERKPIRLAHQQKCEIRLEVGTLPVVVSIGMWTSGFAVVVGMVNGGSVAGMVVASMSSSTACSFLSSPIIVDGGELDGVTSSFPGASSLSS